MTKASLYYLLIMVIACSIYMGRHAYSGDGSATQTDWRLLYRGTPEFSTASMQSGGSSRKGVFTTGEPGWLLTESSKGEQSNAGSVFRNTNGLDSNSLVVQRINEILSQPKGQPPVYMGLSFNVEAIQSSNKLISADLSLEFSGNNAPRGTIIHVGRNFYTKLKKLRLKQKYHFTRTDAPELVFPVWPSSAEQSINGIRISVALRVDSGATPEEIALGNVEINEYTPEVFGKPALLSSEKKSPPPIRVLFVGDPQHRPSLEMLESIRKQGLDILPHWSRNNLSITADIYFICGGTFKKIPTDQLQSVLKKGAVLFCDFTPNEWDKFSEHHSTFLPINPWSIQSRNIRESCRVVAAGNTSFIKNKKGKDLFIDWRYDLHLPTAPIESGMHRYEPEKYGKEPWNNRWKILLHSDRDGTFPLLVRGQYKRGTVYVFGSDVSSPRLVGSNGYSGFCNALLKDMVQHFKENTKKSPVGHDPNKTQTLDLKVPPYQPQKIDVTLTNNSSSDQNILLSSRVNAGSGDLLKKSLIPITIPKGKSQQVTVLNEEKTKKTGKVQRISEEPPYRRLHLSLLSADNNSVIMTKEAIVSTASPIGIEVREDSSTYDTLKKWPVSGEWPDGRTGMRYIYNCGEKPAFDILLRNGITNIAPLAKAQDMQWPKNPTISGINDMSLSYSSIREVLPVQGGWAGKQSPVQQLELNWGFPVVMCGMSLEGYGDYRRWNLNNPKNFDLFGIYKGEKKELLKAKNISFIPGWGPNKNFAMQDARRAYFDAQFAAQKADSCKLQINGLDPKGNYENPNYRPSNASIIEWQIWGWPEDLPPPAQMGKVQVTLHNLTSATQQVILSEDIELGQMKEKLKHIELPTFTTFTVARIDIYFISTSGKRHASKSIPMLYIPEESQKLQNKSLLYTSTVGMLCSPGIVQANDFGKGMRNYITGWGGPHDQLWMLLHGLMEWNHNTRYDLSRMLTTPGRICHYTNPWKAMPDGTVAFDMVSRQLLESCLNGKLKRDFTEGKPRTFHFGASDRWNGIPIGNSFGWIEYELFDKYLREKTGNGLTAKGMSATGKEILNKHANLWQQWHMSRYAQRLLDTQEMYAKKDIDFTIETHGSFPLCGGELGKKIARTHTGVGTDLFWELRYQDVIRSIGQRFGFTAVNPDLQNGLYNQWGWVNSELNKFWFANNSSSEPATRQWYLTYFTGQVNTKSEFTPYHRMGVSKQGSYGTKMSAEDFREMFRVQNFTTQVRPEKAAGFGIIASWPGQLKRCNASVSTLGFGIFPAKGEDSVDIRFGEVYQKLVKNGLPISFISSTDAIINWQGKQPLILVDGFNYTTEEMTTVKRLSNSGTPVIAIGDYADIDVDHTLNQQFYGVRYNDGVFTPDEGVEAFPLEGDSMVFVKKSENQFGSVMFCPVDGKNLSPISAHALVQRILETLNNPILLPQGLAATTYISNGYLWLSLSNQSDEEHTYTIQMNPEWFMPELAGKNLRIIDIDNCSELPVKASGSRMQITIDFPASGGKMLLFAPVG